MPQVSKIRRVSQLQLQRLMAWLFAEQRPSVPSILSHPFFQKYPIPQFIPRSALYHKPSEHEIFSSTATPQPVLSSSSSSSPSSNRVAQAMRHAIDEKRSYIDRRPLGPLRIMSENIPDPRSQFPIRDSPKPAIEPTESPTTPTAFNRKRYA